MELCARMDHVLVTCHLAKVDDHPLSADVSTCSHAGAAASFRDHEASLIWVLRAAVPVTTL